MEISQTGVSINNITRYRSIYVAGATYGDTYAYENNAVYLKMLHKTANNWSTIWHMSPTGSQSPSTPASCFLPVVNQVPLHNPEIGHESVQQLIFSDVLPLNWRPYMQASCTNSQFSIDMYIYCILHMNDMRMQTYTRFPGSKPN